MRRCVFALIAALAAGSGVAQPGDPMKSKECRQALDALQEQENKATAEGGRQQPGSLKQLEPFRRDAARACLGGRGDPEPLSSRFAQPPNAVSPAPVRTLSPTMPPPPPDRAISVVAWATSRKRLLISEETLRSGVVF